MNKRLCAAVSAVLSVAFLIGGCGELAAPKDGKASKDKSSAVIYLGTRSEPRMGFDPLKGYANVDGISLFQSNLLKLNQDLSFEKEIAKDYQISEDGLTYTFQLREVKCSDGQPFTAEDVKFSFEEAAKCPLVGNLQDIKSIEIKNPYEVIFHMKQPNSLFLYTVARLPLVPKHAYKEGYGQNPVGTGPYKMVQWNQGQQMIVEANENYFKGIPRLKKLTVLFVNGETALQAAKAGDIDVYDVPYNYADVKISGAKMKAFKSAGKYVLSLPVVKPGAAINPDNKPVGNTVTSDIAIRKALNYGIDRQSIVDNLMHGYGSPAYELVDPEVPYYNSEIAYKDNDVEKAKAILAEAGWKDTDGNGIVEKNGQEANIIVMANAGDKMLQNVAMLISDQAKRMGINFILEPKSAEEINARQHQDCWLMNYGSLDPMNMFYLYYGPNAGKGYYNISYFNNLKVNGYIESAMSAPNAELANEFWKKAQWDGETGFSVRGDPSMLWIANKNYMYQVKEGFSIGEQQSLQPASMGWAITRNIERWGWDE